jgi:[ribosomal protein S5]-alanine N-acetyltransferase
MLNPPETIETERLVLRVPVMEDAAPMLESYARDPEVTRYLAWKPLQSLEEAEGAIRSRVEGWRKGISFSWTILLKEGGALVGTISLRPQGQRLSMGFVVARPYWGRGYTTEAARPVVEWALDQPGVYRVSAVCDTENLASARVLEKIGMQLEGTLRRWDVHPNIGDAPRDCLCYAAVK